MNLQNLRYVFEIINQGSISAAARKLYISQPYLSKILMEVEKEYKLTIFSREKNNLTLTKQGAAFALTVKEVLDTMESYDLTLRCMQDVCHFKFSSCPSAYAAEAYLEFLRINKDSPLRVHYREGDNTSVINDVYTRTSEFGIIILKNEEMPSIYGLLKNMHISCEKLYDLEMYLIARIGHPLSRLPRPIEAADLYEYDFVMYPQHLPQEYHAGGIAQYEYTFPQIDWSRIRRITYVQSRAQYYDMIQRTDTISFGFQPIREQEMTRRILSLRFSPEFIGSLKQDGNSSLYRICMEGHEYSPQAAQFFECLRNVCS